MVWEVKKIEELSKRKDAIVSGPFGSNLKVEHYKNKGIPIIRLQNIGKGYFINKDIKYISEEKAEELKYHSFISGDIVLAKLGIPIGKACKIPDDFKRGIIVADVVRIRLDKNIIDYDFLEYYLNTDLSVSQLTKNVSGATRPRVNLSDVRNIVIDLPPLPIQKRIVAILDEAFEKISKAKENAEKNLKNAIEIFESYLQSVFENKGEGWEESNIEEYIKLIDYRGRTPKKTESGIRLITAKNVKLGYLQLEPQEFIHEDNYETWMTRGIPNYGDVIFTTEAPLANVAQINTHEKLAFAQRIIVMQPQKNKIDQTFLRYMLLSKPIRKKILEKGTGATVQGIKSRLLKKIRIYFPKTIAEQQSIVKKLDTLSAETKKFEAIYTQKLTDLEELKKSFLQKAFKGELLKG